MRLTAEVDKGGFDEALREYMADQKKSLPQAMRFQGKLLAQTLVKFTPPKTLPQGRKAVARDIQKVYTPIVTRDLSGSATAWGTRIKSARIRERVKAALRARDPERVFKILSGAGWEIDREQIINFDPRFHRAARSRRGRVEKPPRLRRLVMDAPKLTAYLRKKQNMVGQAKGGWAAGAAALGGNPGGWIARHARAGKFKDTLRSLIDPSLAFENDSEWAQAGDEDRIVSNAIKSRAAAIRDSLARANFNALARAERLSKARR